MVIFVPCFYFSRCCQYSSGFLGLYIYLPKLCIQHCNEFRTWPKLVQFDAFLSWPASKLREAKNLCLVFSCNDANNGWIFWEIKSMSNIFVFLVVSRQSDSNFFVTRTENLFHYQKQQSWGEVPMPRYPLLVLSLDLKFCFKKYWGRQYHPPGAPASTHSIQLDLQIKCRGH